MVSSFNVKDLSREKITITISFSLPRRIVSNHPNSLVAFICDRKEPRARERER